MHKSSLAKHSFQFKSFDDHHRVLFFTKQFYTYTRHIPSVNYFNAKFFIYHANVTNESEKKEKNV